MKFIRNMLLREDHICPWWLAYTFDNPLRRFVHDPEALLNGLAGEGMAVADIGCGMGYFSIGMARLVGAKGTVTAVDLQQEMLDIMLKRAGKAGVSERIHPVLARTDDISISTPVDFVLLFWMVHEVGDIPKFLGQVRSILKPGGKALYAEPKLHVPQARFGEILAFAQEAGFRVESGPRVRFSRSAILSKEA